MDLCTCRIPSYHNKLISSKKCITYILRMSNLFGVSIQIIIIMKTRIGKRTRITDTVVRSSVQKIGKWHSEWYQPQAPYQLQVATEQHQTCPSSLLSSPAPGCPCQSQQLLSCLPASGSPIYSQGQLLLLHLMSAPQRSCPSLVGFLLKLPLVDFISHLFFSFLRSAGCERYVKITKYIVSLLYSVVPWSGAIRGKILLCL